MTARLEAGTLRVLKGRCPNLLAEASLYRYSDDRRSETPVDDHNHALAALRYLIALRQPKIAAWLREATRFLERRADDGENLRKAIGKTRREWAES